MKGAWLGIAGGVFCAVLAGLALGMLSLAPSQEGAVVVSGEVPSLSPSSGLTEPMPPPPPSPPLRPEESTPEPTLFMPAPSASAGGNGGTQIFAPQAAYPLDQWQRQTQTAGAITQYRIVSFSASPGASLKGQPLTAQQSLLLSGWAGDPVMGRLFSHVVFSLCDLVIGAAEITEPTPSLARTLHPNLTAAGWSARVPVAFLPRCAAPVLRAWAVKGGGVLLPLEGEQPLQLSLEDARLILPTNGIVFAPLQTPSSQKKPPTQVIRVSGSGANLRRCGDLSCSVTGVLPHGDFPARVFNSRFGWTLVETEDGKAGWISDGTYTVLSVEQARKRPLPALGTE